MAKFNRRQLLLGGVAASTVATLGTEYVRRERAAAEQATLEALAAEYYDADAVLQVALTGDTRMVKEFQEIQASATFPPPAIPYDRQISKRLILCSRLATQQYLTGRNDPKYDGNLRTLPEYDASLDAYELVANFKGEESEVNDKIEIQVPPDALNDPTQVAELTELESNLGQAEDVIQGGVTEIVKISHKVPVFFGFVLESPTDSIIVFRGTQRTAEWIGNIYAVQEDYIDRRTGQKLGRIHKGFRRIVEAIIDPIPQEIAKQLNPNKPCYVSGHSLGSALATLIAIDIALEVPALQPQIQLYAYASPRVGDPEFVRNYARLLPNSFRITNLADPIPMLPPTKLRTEFVHVGEEWSFISQGGDILPNHIVDTYRQAVYREAETNQARDYPASGLV